MRTIALRLLVVLLAGCLPELPTPPALLDPDFRCDDAGRWAFEVRVEHDEPVVDVSVDAWLLLPSEQDGVLLATIALEADGDRWGTVTEPGPLQCGVALEYALVFLAEDEGGDVGLRQVLTDGAAAHVDRWS